MVRSDSTWELEKPLRNILAGSKLHSPVGMHDNFDIGVKGIIFAATEDDLADPTKTVSISVYQIPLPASSTASIDAPARIPLQMDGDDAQSSSCLGWCSNPSFSPDGSTIAFLGAPTRASLFSSIWIKRATSQSAVDVFTAITGTHWIPTPDSFQFAPDGQSLYIGAQDCGRNLLYELELRADAVPTCIVIHGSLSSYHVLSKHGRDGDTVRLLVTSSSLVDPWICQIVQTGNIAGLEPQVLSNLSQQMDIGLSRKQISEIYFKGAGDYSVHAWVVKPSDFDPSKKYPLCVLVHGGPYAAWNDAWSTRVCPVFMLKLRR
jgi:dipeptidyl aminopeptidase/acylaminoacyl peptidase